VVKLKLSCGNNPRAGAIVTIGVVNHEQGRTSYYLEVIIDDVPGKRSSPIELAPEEKGNRMLESSLTSSVISKK